VPYLPSVIASIGTDAGSATGFFVTVFVFLVPCAVSLTGGGRSICRDARGWAGRTGGTALLVLGAGFWLLAAFVGVFGTIVVFDLHSDHREQVTTARRSCEASTAADFPGRKAEIKRCIESELLD
jgi:hypothetical protein